MTLKLISALFAGLFAIGTQAQTWQAAGTQPVPTGAVMYFALQACPQGWVEANGAPISQAVYPKLYAAIGGNLPDLRGEFIRGWDHGRGADPGRILASYQTDEIKSHTHNVAIGAMAAPGSVPVVTGSGPGVAATAAAGATETRPRNMALLVCIKA